MKVSGSRSRSRDQNGRKSLGLFSQCKTSIGNNSSTVFQKSDAKIQISITPAYLIRIKYPLSGFNYHLSDVNVAKFQQIPPHSFWATAVLKMELKNTSFQYGKYRFRTIACMPHLEAGRGRYPPSVSCVLGPLSQNLSWCRLPCRYLELPNWCSLSLV